MNEELRNRLVLKFPFLGACGAIRPEGAGGDRSEKFFFERITHFMTLCLLSHFNRHGLMDEGLHKWLDKKLPSLAVPEQIEFQMILLEKYSFPFRDVFSLQFRSRDTYHQEHKRHRDVLQAIWKHYNRENPAESAMPASYAASLDEYFECLLGSFRSELVEVPEKREGAAERIIDELKMPYETLPDGGGVLLATRENNRFLYLHPLAMGTKTAQLDLFSRLRTDGVEYLQPATGNRTVRTDHRTLESLGRLFLRIGAFRLASLLAARLRRDRAPEERQPLSSLLDRCYSGVEAFRNGRMHLAVLELEKVLRHLPELSAAAFYLSRAYRKLNSQEKAIAALEGVLPFHPGSENLYALLGDLYMEKGELETAKLMYQKGVGLNLHNPFLLKKLSACRMKEMGAAGSRTDSRWWSSW